jgi:hypothetical protein
MKSAAMTLLAVLLLVPSVSALTIEQGLEIQPNSSQANGYYVVADASKSLDELLVNSSHATFIATNSGIWNYDTGAELCASATDCALASTETIINITFTLVDITPPDVNWVEPTANGTETANQTYIFWNISSTESIGIGFIEINGSNNTCTSVNGTISHCSYNQTGIESTATYCAFGFAFDAAGNSNRTIDMICRNTNITEVIIPVPVIPSSNNYFIAFDHMLNYIFLIADEIMEAWYTNMVYGEMWFHNDTAQGAITSIASQGIWVNVTGFQQAEESGQTLSGVSYSNGALIADEDGIYIAKFSMSFGNVGNNQEYQLLIAVNNVVQNNTDTHRKIGAAGDVGNAGNSGFIELTEGDAITLFIRNNDGTADVGTHAASLNIMKVGET